MYISALALSGASHCLQTAMALRLIEPPALVQSMLSA